MEVSPLIEEHLLGGLIEGISRLPDETTSLLRILEAQHFGRAANRAIFLILLDMHRQGCTIDLVTLYNYARAMGLSHAVRASHLATIWDERCRPEDAAGVAELLIHGISRAFGPDH